MILKKKKQAAGGEKPEVNKFTDRTIENRHTWRVWRPATFSSGNQTTELVHDEIPRPPEPVITGV